MVSPLGLSEGIAQLPVISMSLGPAGVGRAPEPVVDGGADPVRPDARVADDARAIDVVIDGHFVQLVILTIDDPASTNFVDVEGAELRTFLDPSCGLRLGIGAGDQGHRVGRLVRIAACRVQLDRRGRRVWRRISSRRPAMRAHRALRAGSDGRRKLPLARRAQRSRAIPRECGRFGRACRRRRECTQLAGCCPTSTLPPRPAGCTPEPGPACLKSAVRVSYGSECSFCAGRRHQL